MPVLDWVFAAVLLMSMLLGAWRGFVYEVLSLISWVAAFVLAQWLAQDLAQRLPMSGASDTVRYASGFVPVSYTHLDVYKRQVCAHLRDNSACYDTSTSNP